MCEFPFIQAKHYTRAKREPHAIRLIVIHSTESSEGLGNAEAIAKWFAADTAPQASAHYVIDPGATVQCVAVADVAWHAGRVNGYSVGLELCGKAGQTREQWTDGTSFQMLDRASKLVRRLSEECEIPLEWVSDAALVDGTAHGLTTHAQISRAFKVPGGHWDPGPNFPGDLFLALCQAERPC